MNISIIIPNYNGENLLKYNLPRVLSATHGYEKGEVEIILVDDGSSDGSWEYLVGFAEQHNNIRIIKNEKNYGFSTTVNRGAAKAVGDILVLLNSDVVPENGFLKKVVSHFIDDQTFGVGFMDKSVEGEHIVLRGRGIITWYRGFILHEWGETNKSNTLWVSGGSGAFRKKLWNKLGGFNELYNPFYWEDIDLSYRAIKNGYAIHFDREITTTHEHEKGAIRTQNDSSKIKTYAYRNQFLFFWLNITDFSLWIKHLLWLPVHIVNILRDRDKEFAAGFMQACIRSPRVILYRLKSHGQNKIKDVTILQQYHS